MYRYPLILISEYDNEPNTLVSDIVAVTIYSDGLFLGYWKQIGQDCPVSIQARCTSRSPLLRVTHSMPFSILPVALRTLLTLFRYSPRTTLSMLRSTPCFAFSLSVVFLSYASATGVFDFPRLNCKCANRLNYYHKHILAHLGCFNQFLLGSFNCGRLRLYISEGFDIYSVLK